MDVVPDHQIITVDGEQFSADYDPDRPGAYHFGWLTGPNPGYGFIARDSSHTRQPQQYLVDQIIDFLNQFDPQPRYIEDK